MSWKRYAAERTIAFACWLIVVVLLVFLIYRVLAPFPIRVGGEAQPAEQREQVLDHASSGLGDFFGQLLGGSLGESFFGSSPDANEVVASAAPVTVSVVLGAIVVALALGIPLGFLWAGRRLRGVRLLGNLALALLPVWVGLKLSYFVGFRWDLTPIAGYCDLFNPPTQAQCGGAVDWARHLQLPWATLALPLTVLYARAVRALVEDVRATPVAEVAARRGRRRAAGVAMTRLVTRDFGVLLGIAVFVEVTFGLPGFGALHYETLFSFDYPVGEGILLATAGLALAVQLTVDLILAAVAPEARPA